MLKTLKTLIRVQDNQLQNLRKKLSQAHQQEGNIVDRIDKFDKNFAREQEISTQDYLLSQTFSNYINHALTNRQKLQMLLNDAKAVTKIAHDNLSQSHAEMKRLENIKNSELLKLQKELEMKEQKATDDLIQATYKPVKIYADKDV
ncbi:MAG: flagellar FliJ family protein [Alphaproteobacteria bacterium]|nr:flagellar FliJ family protein [Alphaproteobacteria bacterium]